MRKAPRTRGSGSGVRGPQMTCGYVRHRKGTDLAQHTDGTWRVAEVGDGQVSDLPTGTDPTALLDPLLTLHQDHAPASETMR